MHIRSGKALKEMAQPTNSGTSVSSQSSSQAQSTHASNPYSGCQCVNCHGATLTMPVSTEMGVTAPATVSTTAAAMTQPEMGAFVPPFTTSIHVSTTIPMSPHHQIRARLDYRVITMQNFTIPMTTMEQPYGMPTSMMASLHNNAFIADNAISFTPYNAHIASSYSVPGRNAPPALSTKSMISLRQQMDESNHDMVSMLIQQIGTFFNPLF